MEKTAQNYLKDKQIWVVFADPKEISQDALKQLQSSGIVVRFCGIGLLESFYIFGEMLHKAAQMPDGIILAGTAGSPNPEHLFKMNLSNHFLMPAFVSEEIPEFLSSQWQTEKFLPEFVPGDFLSLPVYSTFGISRQSHANMEGAWENMEALSLSYFCFKKKIPFTALLCCSNQIGPGGRLQWKNNFTRAGELLANALSSLLCT